MLKKMFYAGIAGLILFEIAQVYFIMPMPGSQAQESLDFAYFLYIRRWIFRGILVAVALAGLLPAWKTSRIATAAALAVLAVAAYMLNGEMSADRMFYQPGVLNMAPANMNRIPSEKLVLGVSVNGHARAYPIQFLGYHHQVRDTVGGQPVMVTYCTVCRTGRVYEPVVDGKPETFRLVGMDHFNAMFEDSRTGTWWRQVTGEAVAGPLKGAALPELPVFQTSLAEWLRLYPQSLVMQGDSTFKEEYADMDTYDVGLNRGSLTTTDTSSWNDKSWIVGIAVDQQNARAFDWNRLKREKVIHAAAGSTPVLLVLAGDEKSFFAFKRSDAQTVFTVQHDTIRAGDQAWNLLGEPVVSGGHPLERINAYQEFWHSWRTFHPHTTRY